MHLTVYYDRHPVDSFWCETCTPPTDVLNTLIANGTVSSYTVVRL